MPVITGPLRAGFEAFRVGPAESQRPVTNGLVGNNHAAFRHELFDIPQAQREPEIQPDAVADDFRWKSTAMVKRL